jgi:hypothetical protein
VGAAIEQIEITIPCLAQANKDLSDVVYQQGQQLDSLRVQLSGPSTLRALAARVTLSARATAR